MIILIQITDYGHVKACGLFGAGVEWGRWIEGVRYNLVEGPNHLKYSSVRIATDYWLDGPCSIPGSERIFSSPQRPDRLLGPPSLLCNLYRVLFPQGKAAGG
jgi:hypothetical protein